MMRISAASLLLALITLPLRSQTISDFQSAVEYPSFVHGMPMALSADFNKDGKQDLLTIAQNGQGGEVCVYPGQGDGTFAAQVCTPILPPYVRAAAVGDLNGDGLPDVVIASDCQDQPNPTCSSGSIIFLLGKGDGTFVESWSYETGGISDQAFTLGVADFNGDNQADVVATLACNNIATLGCTQAAILVFNGNGDGTFAAPATYIPVFGNGSLPVVVGDLNGDGHPDIVVGNQYAPGDQTHSSLSVLLGKSGGGFSCSDGSPVSNGSALPPACTTALPFYGIYDMVAADFNGDGHQDVATSSYYSGVAVLYGNGNGTLQLPPVLQPVPTQSTTSLAVSDLNGDGHPDLIVASDPWEIYNASSINIFLNDGTGNLQASTAYQGGGVNLNSVVVADFNGDGKQDVVLSAYCSSNCNDGTFNLWLGNGDGTLRSYPVVPFGSVVASDDYPVELVGDINGDGIPDLMRIARDSSSNTSELSVSLGSGGGKFEAPYEVPLGQQNGDVASTALLGDFNKDGKLDIAVAFLVGASGTDGAVSVLLGNGDGTFALQQELDSGGVFARSIASADMNGDGYPDLVVANQCADSNCTAGSFTTLLGNGSGGFSPVNTVTTPYLVDDTSVVAADFNGDGRIDLAIGGTGSQQYCTSIGGCYLSYDAISTYLGNGNGTFTVGSTYSSGGVSTPVSLALGDVNRDGRLDIVAANQCTSTSIQACTNGGGVGVLLGNGDGSFSGGTSFAVPDASFLSANLFDLNADGKLDFIGATADGVYVAYGKGDGTFNPGVVYAGLGRNTQSTLAVADVNGDGSPDILVPGVFALAVASESSPATAILYNQLSVSTLPAAPSNLAASAASNSEIDLQWINHANNATYIDVEQSTDGTNFAQISAASPSATTFAVTGLTLGSKYWFRVRAQNASGYSSYSNLASATTFSPSVSLSTTTLNFGMFQIGGLYPIPQVKLNNTGTGPLTITNIKNSGANPGDFNDSNNCPVSPSILSAGSSCTFQLSFTPTQPGPRSASISIADNATGSPQSILLSGTAVDFSLSVAPISNTTKGGKAASYTITVTPLGGNTLTTTLSAAGCPSGATCTLSKSSFALNGSSSTTATLTVKPGSKTPKGTYTLTVNGQVFTVTHSSNATLLLQ